MNSEKLQQRFPDIYQTFFQQAPLVAAAPFSMTWMTDSSIRFRGAVIRQKIPLKGYVGVEETGQAGEISLGTVTWYESGQDRFSTPAPLSSIFAQTKEVAKYMESHFSVKLGSRGIRFHALLEMAIDRGMSCHATLTALIAFLLCYRTNQVSSEQIKQWRDVSVEELLKNDTYGFTKVAEHGRNMDHITKYGNTWGTGVISSLVPSRFPFVTFPQQKPEVNLEEIMKEKMDVLSYRLNELFPQLPRKVSWPIDYAIIFSGKLLNLENSLQKTLTKSKELEDIQAHLRLIKAEQVDKTALFTMKVKQTNSFENTFLETNAIVSLMLVSQLAKMMLKSHDEREAEMFIEYMKKRHSAATVMDPVSPYITKFLARLNSQLASGKQYNNYATFCFDDITLGGSIGFVSLKGIQRDIFSNTANKIVKEFPVSSIDYMSWEDGSCDDGVEILQDIEKKTFSRYIPPESIIMSRFEGKTSPQRLLTSHSAVNISETTGLVLDTIQEKIFINGVAPTSKELHSHKVTIQLLRFLLSSKNHEISNKDLPRSAYSLSKNEMEGKIVRPFNSLIKTKLGKDENFLICIGNNTDFCVYMNMNTININLYQKLFEF